jgi:membrane associated rhomboid family serine protease
MPHPASSSDSQGGVVILQILMATVLFYAMQQILGPQFDKSVAFTSAQWWQPWRWLTYQFCHADFWHILFNLWSLIVFGPRVAELIGGRHFLRLYFLSGAIGAGLWLLFNHNSSLIGASGSVFGVMAAAALLTPDDEVYLMFVLPVKIRALVVVYAVLNVFALLNTTSDIAHLAHLGGLLGGLWYCRRSARLGRAAPVKVVAPSRPALHRCAVCERTEHDAPKLDFRVCSRCSDGAEYCEEHLDGHSHS